MSRFPVTHDDELTKAARSGDPLALTKALTWTLRDLLARVRQIEECDAERQRRVVSPPAGLHVVLH